MTMCHTHCHNISKIHQVLVNFTEHARFMQMAVYSIQNYNIQLHQLPFFFPVGQNVRDCSLDRPFSHEKVYPNSGLPRSMALHRNVGNCFIDEPNWACLLVNPCLRCPPSNLTSGSRPIPITFQVQRPTRDVIKVYRSTE